MRIIDETPLWEGDFLRAVLLTYQGEGGDIHTWEAYERPGVRGVVVVVPVTDEGDIVLIRQFRPPVGRYVWEVPAGLMDGDESPEECAVRELREETGYRPRRLVPLIEGPGSPATSRSILRVFLARGLEWVGCSGGDPNEEIEVRVMGLEEAFSRMCAASRDGELVDLKILGLIELARRAIAATEGEKGSPTRT